MSDDNNPTPVLYFKPETVKIEVVQDVAKVHLTTHQIAAALGRGAKDTYALRITDKYRVEKDDSGNWTLTVTRNV